MTSDQRILIYYDGTEEARSALDAHTHVLTVVDTGAAIMSTAGLLCDLAYVGIENTTRDLLKEALDHMKASDIMVTGHIAVGNVVNSIAQHAEMLDADLLVVGHRIRRGIARWLGGPATYSELVERSKGRTVITVALA
jgi:nucleotide-binding universal stress UspA family protein